ncbi:Transposase [Pseudomonas syringae pv. apii]|uniref:Transposase n=3 Tax=Pseudomonas TaxID=286 RepID=A0A3M5X335_9PSED|nr:Transposase [Pseudomonas syringae pv. apii]
MSAYFYADAITLNARIVMRQRKSYPKSFKTQVVQECEQLGVSVAAIAMSHGINANVVRRWIPLYRDQQAVALPAFIPLKVAPVEPNIRPKRQRSLSCRVASNRSS